MRKNDFSPAEVEGLLNEHGHVLVHTLRDVKFLHAAFFMFAGGNLPVKEFKRMSKEQRHDRIMSSGLSPEMKLHLKTADDILSDRDEYALIETNAIVMRSRRAINRLTGIRSFGKIFGSYSSKHHGECK